MRELETTTVTGDLHEVLGGILEDAAPPPKTRAERYEELPMPSNVSLDKLEDAAEESDDVFELAFKVGWDRDVEELAAAVYYLDLPVETSWTP